MRAGIATTSITPPVGVDLTGYVGRTGPSNRVHDELSATALVLDDGATRIAVISVDILGTDLAQDAALRESISDATGIAPENLMVASTHTHSGPAIGVLRQCGEPDDAYVRRMFTQIVSATKEACANMADARISYVRGESELAWNRREWVISAGVQQSPASGVVTDPEIGGLLIEIEGQKPVMLFNYACHGVVMGGDNLEISADWIGAARDALESSGKIGTAIFLQGCCGNINPRWRGSFDEVRHAGESVANPLLADLPNAKPLEDPTIRVAWARVDLPYMPLPSEESLEQEISFQRGEIEKFQAQGNTVHLQVAKAMAGWAESSLAMLNDGGGPESVAVGLQVIRIGDVVLVTHPGEAFCEFGLAFRKMTTHAVLPVAYANGNIGYIPTAEAYKEGGYEVDNAIRFYGEKMIGPESEGIILDAVRGLLAEVGKLGGRALRSPRIGAGVRPNRREFLTMCSVITGGALLPNAVSSSPSAGTSEMRLPERSHKAQFCVVGGGLAGVSAAVCAARHGTKTVLIHERPMLGGNCSSEVRMWVCGARGANNRESGLVEEMMLDNLHRNPGGNWNIWDSVVYEKAAFEPNLTLLLNCSCNGAVMDGNRVKSVRAWQMTTQTWHIVEADLFADCSGDSILAPLTGAEHRVGREARSEFGEDIEPEKADRKTMGMSCLIQARQTDRPQEFTPPKWANVYESDDDLPNRGHSLAGTQNFWWIELGGEQDSIHDTETVRDELLKVAFGIWDHIKNRGDHGAANWELSWVGFLPGKRESRRYVGDVIMNQKDVRAEGKFEDLVAYAGWTMDDHHPAGILYPGKPTIFHPAPSPFGIPYRSLYSRNVENLFCAGRNISVTHAALSATRVQGTCSTIGQAVGTAASIAAREHLSPRGVYEHKLSELQQALMDDDAYLPWHRRAVPVLSLVARLIASEGDPEPLRNGIDRPVGEDDNGWTGALGGWVAYEFGKPERLTQVRLVFDSDLNRTGHNARALYTLADEPRAVPKTMVKSFRVEAKSGEGEWKTVAQVTDNHQRLVRVPLDVTATSIRLVPESTWGAENAHLFGFEVR